MWYSHNFKKGPLFHSEPESNVHSNNSMIQSNYTNRTKPSQIKVVQNKVNIAQKNLQKGYDVTKYSKDGFFYHEKKIFLSLDCKKLCWC